MTFDLTPDDREKLWKQLITETENFYANTASLPVAPALNLKAIQNYITDFAGSGEKGLPGVLDHVIKGMTAYAVHTAHPAYFGLFNPRANFPSILADAITAVFNPQLAAWSHAPFAAEVEGYLINLFGQKFGYASAETDGVFTTGGAEANLTALLCALNFVFPAYAESGLQNINAKPLVYCSAESHHSIVKAVRVVGLGSAAVRTVPVDKNLKMDAAFLNEQVSLDVANGFFPLMVIATAGTTGAGIIDPLLEIAAIATQNKLWLHADAAYGGGLVLSSSVSLLKGIEKADSITFDAHKWLSVPMGTSMFLTRHKTILGQTFRISAEYMPKDAEEMEITDPFVHSIQWSRRFNGLKVYMALLMLGEKSHIQTIDHQVKMGQLLKQQLINNGWDVYNDTLLPVVCFGRPSFKTQPGLAGQITQKVIQNGKVWLSVYPVNGTPSLRACITNYNTGEAEIELLVNELNEALN